MIERLAVTALVAVIAAASMFTTAFVALLVVSL